jgi:hypothetical protein
MTIKKLLTTSLLLLTVAIHAQNDLNSVTGHYISEGGDLLTMHWDKTFRRVTGTNVVTGTFEIVNNKLQIKKPTDGYELYFFVGTTTLVITKPRSKQAWLFRKISN